MDLHLDLQRRAAEGRPVRVGLIGAGKFGTMFLAQARRTTGLQVLAVADLSLPRARRALELAGFEEERYAAGSYDEAIRTGATHLTEDAQEMIATDGLDVVVEATGNPGAGVAHALACIANRRHVVMVTVEADVLVGPLLARRAAEAGVGYSMAYGDQPALICELIDWARTSGFDVVCAGKGTKHLPEYHRSTPETVWGHYGFSDEDLAAGDLNPVLFNSFLDGTKSAIEMASVANAAGLRPPADGLLFPPAGVPDLAQVCKPRDDGGWLEQAGTVEVVSSLQLDGSPVEHDLRWGVYVTVEASTDYVARCFGEYGMITDDTGRYTALYRPYHYIGLELGVSVASLALRGRPTGTPREFLGDVVATAKRDLVPGDQLDGEGGRTVYGRLARAEDSLARDWLPIGLAHGPRVTRPVAAGEAVSRADVGVRDDDLTARTRRELEQVFAPAGGGEAPLVPSA